MIHLRARAALAAAVLLAACGGGSEDETDGTAQDPPASSAPSDDDTSGDDGGAGDDGFAASGSDEFQQILERARAATYTVSYAFLDPADGTDTFVLSHEGEVTGILQPGGEHLIQDAQGLMFCDESSCTRTGGGASLDMMLQGFLGPFAALMSAESSTGFFTGVDLDVRDETIAGRSAKCITLDPSRIAQFAGAPADAEIESCLDEATGIMLRTRVTGEGETSGLEATAFSDTGDPAILTPPFAPQSPGG